LEQGALGAIIVLLVAALVALWIQYQKKEKEFKAQTENIIEDICGRNTALTDIIRDAIQQELKLANQYAEHSREFHTTLTLLTGFIKELESERGQQDNSHSG